MTAAVRRAARGSGLRLAGRRRSAGQPAGGERHARVRQHAGRALHRLTPAAEPDVVAEPGWETAPRVTLADTSVAPDRSGRVGSTERESLPPSIPTSRFSASSAARWRPSRQCRRGVTRPRRSSTREPRSVSSAHDDRARRRVHRLGGPEAPPARSGARCALLLGAGWLALHLLLGVEPDQDLTFYAEDGRAVLDGTYPRSEYPTGAVALFALETWLGASRRTSLHAATMLGFHLVTVAAIWSVGTQWSAWLAAFVAVWPLNLFHWELRYDLAPTAFLVVGLVLAFAAAVGARRGRARRRRCAQVVARPRAPGARRLARLDGATGARPCRWRQASRSRSRC